MKDVDNKKKDYKIDETLKFDIRLQLQNLAHNFISKDELEKHLKTLPDEAANASTLEFSEDASGSKPEGLTFL